jgi:pSer/pThr/pTyr-binding forkhead associated (FHA) protein
MYVLEAMNGPQDGKRWVFERDIVIGRDADSVGAALPVDHAVSRQHARIESQAGGLLVTDLHSSNGTILDGEPIARATQLSIGEPFVVGRTMLRVLRTDTNSDASTSVR